LLAASKTASRNPERDYCLLLLMFRHGLRVSEACRLKLSDIDLETKVFHVRRLKGCDHGVHDFYNGESASIGAWLLEREKMNPSAEVEELFISERRQPLSRITVFLALKPCLIGEHGELVCFLSGKRGVSRGLSGKMRPQVAIIANRLREQEISFRHALNPPAPPYQRAGDAPVRSGSGVRLWPARLERLGDVDSVQLLGQDD
jgi:hypothetical protein